MDSTEFWSARDPVDRAAQYPEGLQVAAW